MIIIIIINIIITIVIITFRLHMHLEQALSKMTYKEEQISQKSVITQ